jgi:hypothetical protein
MISTRRRSLTVLLILVVGTPVITIATLKLAPRFTPPRATTRFDAAKWRADRGVRSGIRLEMADQLINDAMLRDMTRADVTKLLGQQDDVTTGLRDEPVISYFLGPARNPFEIDDEWLDVQFGSTGRVDKYWISDL